MFTQITQFIAFLYAKGPLLLQGTTTTLKLWVIASVISIVVGLLLGIIRAQKSRIWVLSDLADLFTLILRGVPLYAQLTLIYFVLPELISLKLSAFESGFIALGLCSAAYTSEIIRAGINSVPNGQWQAAFVLGYSKFAQIRYIILPQALRAVLPALINEYVMTLKSTSLLAAIGVVELTKVGMNIMARSLEPVFISLSIALIYLFLTLCVTYSGRLLERKYNAYSY